MTLELNGCEKQPETEKQSKGTGLHRVENPLETKRPL